MRKGLNYLDHISKKKLGLRKEINFISLDWAFVQLLNFLKSDVKYIYRHTVIAEGEAGEIDAAK